MAEQRTEPELMFKEKKVAGGPPPPWPVDVDVILESLGPPAQFRIESYLQTVAKGDLTFHNRGRPGFKVFFHLHDETGGSYVFPQNASDAVWSQPGTTCPTAAVYGVFEPLSVSADGLTLSVQNDNPGPQPIGRFQYTLRVTNDGGGSYVALDPGGNDMNGGTSIK